MFLFRWLSRPLDGFLYPSNLEAHLVESRTTVVVQYNPLFSIAVQYGLSWIVPAATTRKESVIELRRVQRWATRSMCRAYKSTSTERISTGYLVDFCASWDSANVHRRVIAGGTGYGLIGFDNNSMICQHRERLPDHDAIYQDEGMAILRAIPIIEEMHFLRPWPTNHQESRS